MILASIGAATWFVWGLVGVIGGYMTGKLLTSGGLSMVLNIILGIAAAIGGGYAFIMWFGENDYGQTISLIGSVVSCGVVLWLLNLIFPKRNDDDEID